MGDNFLKQQTQNFRKARDLAISEMEQPSLFDRVEVVQTIYSVAPGEGITFAEGEMLLAVASTEKATNVGRGPYVVGVIDGDGAKALSEALRATDATGCVPMRIVSVSPISGMARAVVFRE